MKRVLIALAAIAISASAFAQSSVNLSGTIDVGVENVGGANSTTKVLSGRNTTSAWTLSGTEDLGGGLKAIFKVSTAFNSDEGTVTTANGLGNNDMFVGLQGGFGTLKLGRSFSTAFTYALTANSSKGVTGYHTRSGNLQTDGVWISNKVMYTTPSYNGFSAQVAFAPSEVNGASHHRAVAVSYAKGPVVVNYVNSKLAAATANQQVNALNLVAASYDFGVLKTVFSYTDRDNVASNADNTMALGVIVPLGAAHQVWASVDRTELGAPGVQKVVHGGYKYFMSKRTTAYVNVGHKKNPIANAGKATTGWGVGLAHNF